MAVLRLFYRAQFGKSLADLREVEQRIVSESVLPRGASRMTPSAVPQKV